MNRYVESPTPNPLGGSRLDLRKAERQGRSYGSAAFFWWRSSEHAGRPEGANLDESDRHPSRRSLPTRPVSRSSSQAGGVCTRAERRSRPASVRPSPSYWGDILQYGKRRSPRCCGFQSSQCAILTALYRRTTLLGPPCLKTPAALNIPSTLKVCICW